MISYSLTGFKGKNFEVRIEYSEDYFILHLLEISKFTKETFLEMKAMLKELALFARVTGYEDVFTGCDESNHKIRRLVSGLDFQFQGVAEGTCVYRYIGE
jgi:hypothetical protein